LTVLQGLIGFGALGLISTFVMQKLRHGDGWWVVALMINSASIAIAVGSGLILLRHMYL
jgi:hypothetical protein